MVTEELVRGGLRLSGLLMVNKRLIERETAVLTRLPVLSHPTILCTPVVKMAPLALRKVTIGRD